MTGLSSVVNLGQLQRGSLRFYSVRVCIVASIVLVSVYMVPRVPEGHVLLLVGALAGAWFVALLLRKPVLGIVGVIVAALLVPIEIGTGTNTTINAAILLLSLLLGLWLLDMFVGKRRIQLVPSRTNLPLLLLVVVAMLAFVVGQLTWFSVAGAPLTAQLGGLAVFLFSAVAFLLVANRVDSLVWLERMTWLFLSIGALYMTARIVPAYGPFILGMFPRGATGSLFWVWLVALAFSQALLNQRLSPIWRCALFLLVAVTFYVVYAQGIGWKSGYIPPLAAVAAIIGLRWWRPALIALPFALIPASTLAARLIATDSYSWSTRLEAWRILLEMLKQNPLLGFGPANYYWYASLFPIRGYFVVFNSHSQYIDLLLQTGILGLACFLWFVWAVGRVGWRIRSRAPAGFAQAYVYGALGGLAGTLVAGALGDWVLPFVYNIGLSGMRASLLAWLLLGGLVALEQIVKSDQETIEPAVCI